MHWFIFLSLLYYFQYNCSHLTVLLPKSLLGVCFITQLVILEHYNIWPLSFALELLVCFVTLIIYTLLHFFIIALLFSTQLFTCYYCFIAKISSWMVFVKWYGDAPFLDKMSPNWLPLFTQNVSISFRLYISRNGDISIR